MRHPRGFKPAGDLLWASLCLKPPTFKRKRTGGRKIQGLKYEKRVHEHFQGIYGDFYLPSPWFMFRERKSTQVRYCQPDALLFDYDLGRITIVEVKYQHVEMSWWQLHKLYAPIVKQVFGDKWIPHFVSVVKWYDPAIPYPEEVRLCKTLDEAPALGTGVHIWRP